MKKFITALTFIFIYQINFSQEIINEKQLDRLLNSGSKGVSFVYVHSDDCDPSNVIMPYIKKYAKKYDGKIKPYMINTSNIPSNYRIKVTGKSGRIREVTSTPSFIIFKDWNLVSIVQGIDNRRLIQIDYDLDETWGYYSKPHKVFYESGELYGEGNVSNYGDLVGVHKYYYKTGQLKSQTEYNIIGNLINSANWYWENGNIAVSQTYTEKIGYRTGEWREFDKNGQEILSGKFNEFGNDKGIFVKYSSSNKKTIEKDIFWINSAYKIYEDLLGENKFDFDEEHADLAGDRMFRYREYHPNGSIAKVQYYSMSWNDHDYDEIFQLFGFFNSTKSLDDEDRNKIIEKINYRLIHKTYFKNGNIKQISPFKNGNSEGTFIEYFENGNIQYSLKVIDGKPMQVNQNFDNNGRELDMGTLKNGNGTVNFYDSNYNLLGSWNVKNGVVQE